jgi:hypothetical protein
MTPCIKQPTRILSLVPFNTNTTRKPVNFKPLSNTIPVTSSMVFVRSLAWISYCFQQNFCVILYLFYVVHVTLDEGAVLHAE